MSREKTLGELRTEKMFKRLKKTPEGTALAGIIEQAGGRIALARGLGIDVVHIDNWCARGRVSKEGAIIIGNNENFDVTAEQMRPDLTKFQWMDKR